MKPYLERLRNPGTIVSIVSLVILIATALGYTVNNSSVMTIVYALCSIGTILGVCNNPTTPGLDLPFYDEETNSPDPIDKR